MVYKMVTIFLWAHTYVIKEWHSKHTKLEDISGLGISLIRATSFKISHYLSTLILNGLT